MPIKSRLIHLGGALIAASLVMGACTGGGEDSATPEGGAEQAAPRSLLQVVKERGTLRCGVNQTVPGFGFLDPASSEIVGFDIDFCTALAAAVFGTSDVSGQVELVPVTAEERFSSLRTGTYDVLVRNTTWTSDRDGTEGIAFAHVNFYDGQGMMVRSDSPYQALDDMDNTAVCVTAGTTTELNLADAFQSLGLNYEPVIFEENPQLQEAFLAGRCDGWTSDLSQLAGLRSQWPDSDGGPEAIRILPDVMSKEPLAPAVLDGDSDWYDAVNWVVNGIITAEEFGITSQNVDQQAASPPDPRVANLLGVPFEGGEAPDFGLGLSPDFMQHVLRAVGNYAEIYDRHVAPLGLDRGFNALWSDGGLMYAPPFR